MDTLLENPRAIIGGNLPPLPETLPEETKDLRARAEALVDQAGKAIVRDEETAQKTLLLAGMMKDHVGLIDEQRETKKRPYLQATRDIDAHYHGLIGMLATYDGRKKMIGGPLFETLGKVDEYRRKKEAEAEAERRRLEEEARKQREAAEAAERARREAEERERRTAEEAQRRIREAEEAARRAESAAAREAAQRQAAEARAAQEKEAAAARQRQIEAQLAERRAAEEADRLQRQAAATTAVPIDTGYGVKASRRATYKAVITDLTAALRHARRINEADVLACVQKIYDAQVRAGVRSLPGAEVKEDSTTTLRTR